MTQVKNWQVPVTIVCLLTGIFTVYAFRTNSAYQNSKTDVNKSKSLVGIIHYLENETNLMESHVKDIRTDIDGIQRNQAQGSKNSANLQKRLEAAKYYAGLSDAKGPGIVITLDDNKTGSDQAQKADPTQYDAKDYIVHDKNILYLVTVLRSSGAKVISVNDQRIITTSNIRCAGPIIIVNSTRLAPPYIIKAIGNPDQLAEAIKRSDEFVYIQSINLPSQITKQPDVSIPAYNGPIKFTFAQIEKEGTK